MAIGSWVADRHRCCLRNLQPDRRRLGMAGPQRLLRTLGLHVGSAGMKPFRTLKCEPPHFGSPREFRGARNRSSAVHCPLKLRNLKRHEPLRRPLLAGKKRMLRLRISRWGYCRNPSPTAQREEFETVEESDSSELRRWNSLFDWRQLIPRVPWRQNHSRFASPSREDQMACFPKLQSTSGRPGMTWLVAMRRKQLARFRSRPFEGPLQEIGR